MSQTQLVASSTMAQNYFLAYSVPIDLNLEGYHLVPTIGLKQMLLETRL